MALLISALIAQIASQFARDGLDVRNGSKAEVGAFLSDVRFSSDSVAKVVLPKVSKILRAAGAVFM